MNGKKNFDSKAIKLAMKLPVTRCIIFVVVVGGGFSLLVCLLVCLFAFLANATQRPNVRYAEV